MFVDSLDALQSNSSEANMCVLGSTYLEVSSFVHTRDLNIVATRHYGHYFMVSAVCH